MTDQAQAKTPRTLEQKLEAAVALVAKLQGQINAIAILSSVSPGNEVVFKFGRGDKARELTGTVTAVGETEAGSKVARVVTNQGTMDEQAFKVRVADITRNISVEAEEAAAADASEGDAVDPLDQD